MSIVEQKGRLSGSTIRLYRKGQAGDGAGVSAQAGTVGGVKAANQVVLAALALGGCVDLLFYGKAPGISVLLFVGLVLGALFWYARREQARIAWRNLWLLVPLFFFAAMVAVRDSDMLTTLNICAVAGLLLLVVGFFAEGRVEQLGLLGYPLALARAAKGLLVQPRPLAADIRKSAVTNRSGIRRAGEIVRGILLAVPLLLLFTFLLSSADSVFQGYVNKVFQARFLDDAPEVGFRLGIILLAAWMAAGALLYGAGRRNRASSISSGAATAKLTARSRGLGFVEAGLVLGLVNTLFAAFSWIQFTVLFSGQAARTMGFEEYREYVRRGFGELLVVAVLTMILILGLRRAVRRVTEDQERNLKVLNSIMIVLALVMLVSAFERMVVWEGIQFYINTTTRIVVRTFIVWLGLLFGWLFLTGLLRRDRFAIGAFIALLGFLATINIVNPDADVAAYNIGRNDELSTRYLYLLSDDAIPALAAGLQTVDYPQRNELREYLRYRLHDMERDESVQDWPSFNLARLQARETLARLRDAGEILP